MKLGIVIGRFVTPDLDLIKQGKQEPRDRRKGVANGLAGEAADLPVLYWDALYCNRKASPAVDLLQMQQTSKITKNRW